MKRQQISRLELASYLLSPALFVMVTLMVVEAMLAAATTWLVINAGRKVAIGQFLLSDLIWILTAQSASYVVGVTLPELVDGVDDRYAAMLPRLAGRPALYVAATETQPRRWR